MANEIFLHVDDAVVERMLSGSNTKVAELFSVDGDQIFTFPDTMTNEQILIALQFANHLFAKGVERGKALKTHEIKAALGLV